MTKNEKEKIVDVIQQKTNGRLSSEEIQELCDSLPVAHSWWIIILKVLAYAIGLVLAGAGTQVSAQTFIQL